MRNILKKLAFILAFILMTEAVMADTEVDIREMNSDGETLFENIIDNEHSEFAIETTTESLIVEDKVESSASIVLDLLSKLKEFKNGMVKDGVVSDSAIDYEIEDNNFPDKIKGLLNDRYFELNETEKFFINQYLYVREDTMTICAEQGLDIAMSIPYALIMQILNVDFEDARTMVIVYESEKAAVEQAYNFGELFADYGIFSDEEVKREFTDYALVGYTAEEVFNAYAFSLLINKTLSEVIYDKHNIVLERSAVLREYEDVMEKYSVRQEAIEEYLNLGYLLEDIDSEIEGMTKALVENDNVSLYSVDSDDSFDVGYDAAFKEGPLSYVNGINDSVDPSTGTLSYTENVCSLPGVNGLDFNLTLTYTSSTTNTSKCIEGRINNASNWRYNIPYITDKDGNVPGSSPRYVILENGSTYEFVDIGDYYVSRNCFTDELKLYEDVNKQGGSNSAYKLTYKNGDIQYFDNGGRWISTNNRFGNSIKVVAGSSSNEKMVIEDTVGRKIVISETTVGSTTTQTITMPDGSTTKFIYLRNEYETRTKKILDKKIDNLGNVTKFDYEVSSKDNCKNALLTKITMPTGLENYYNYGWTSTVEVTTDYGGIDYINGDYEYARIIKKYKNNNGTNCDIYNYSYVSDFMQAKKHFNILCGCTNYCSCKFIYDEYWKCNSNCNNECNGICPKIINDKSFVYNTIIEKEGGTKVKYYFNAANKNTRIDEILENDILNSTYMDYLFSDNYCDLPVKVRYVENGMERIEEYTYTDLYDTKSKIVKQGSNTLSKVEYEYDYDSNSSKHYGICTKIKTKMNNSTDIIQTNELLNSSTSLFNNMAISETTIKRNGIAESHTIYDYAYNNSYDFPDCRLISKTDYALDKSDNSIKNISTVYSYDEGFANPTMVSYQVGTGSSSMLQQYETYYTYDANERIISVRNAENYLTKYKYDGIGNITEVEYPKNKTNVNGNLYDTFLGSDKVSIAYNYKTNTITATNENGKKTVYDYDAVGNKCTVTSKSDGTAGAKDIVLESYKYDTRLRPTEVVTGKAKTTYAYDNRDRVITTKITDKDTGALLSDESYSYVNNSNGLQTTHTLKGDSTAANIVTITQQDVLGRTLTEKTGNATTYTYDMLNNVVKKVRANTETYEYNSNGNVLKTTATTGSSTITTTATYDMLGNMLTSTDGNGNTTSYAYTGLNWLSTVETPFDSTGTTKTYYGYDRVGNIKVSATTNRTVRHEYDYRNRVIKSTMGNQVTRNEYDGVGNITKVTQVNLTGEDQITNYTYDRRYLLTKYTDAMGQKVSQE